MVPQNQRMASSLRPSKAHEEGPNLGFWPDMTCLKPPPLTPLRSEIKPLLKGWRQMGSWGYFTLPTVVTRDSYIPSFCHWNPGRGGGHTKDILSWFSQVMWRWWHSSRHRQEFPSISSYRFWLCPPRNFFKQINLLPVGWNKCNFSCYFSGSAHVQSVN